MDETTCYFVINRYHTYFVYLYNIDSFKAVFVSKNESISEQNRAIVYTLSSISRPLGYIYIYIIEVTKARRYRISNCGFALRCAQQAKRENFPSRFQDITVLVRSLLL